MNEQDTETGTNDFSSAKKLSRPMKAASIPIILPEAKLPVTSQPVISGISLAQLHVWRGLGGRLSDRLYNASFRSSGAGPPRSRFLRLHTQWQVAIWNCRLSNMGEYINA